MARKLLMIFLVKLEVAKMIKTLSGYLNTSMAIILMFGFASGLPLVLIFSVLQAFLEDAGLDLKTIGLTALIGSTYTFKFLWAPLLDNIRLPFLFKLLGRRKSWLLLIQILLMYAIIMVGQYNPATHLFMVLIFTLSVAVLSASQDIVIDAFRVELLNNEQQGDGAAVVQFGYRIAMLVSATVALFLADMFSWRVSYFAMGLLLIPGIITTIIVKEPRVVLSKQNTIFSWIKHSFYMPILDFLSKNGAIYILLFILFYKMSDAFIAPMTLPFFKQVGFSNTEIAFSLKLYGGIATILGGFIGGYFLERVNIYKMLFIGSFLQIAANLAFITLAVGGKNFWYLIFAISAENISGGAGSVILVAYMSMLCNKQFTATQYALLSAIATVARTSVSGFSGFVAESAGWSGFFMLSCLLSMPTFLCLHKMTKKT